MACQNSRTVFPAGVDACLKIQDLFELLFCFAWQQPTQILTLEGEFGGHESSVDQADPQRLSEQTMVRPSVAMARSLVHDFFDIGDQVVTGGGEPTTD